MKIKGIIIGIALAILAVVGLGAFILRGSAEPPIKRVVLLGFDGASPNFLEPLVEQGKLPALKRLMETGSYGSFKTFRPTKSGVLWTSVATGKQMMKHGMIDWTYVKNSGVEVPFEDTRRLVKTYWEILGERGITTGTINWWWTYPPAPVQNGYLITDRFRLLTSITSAPDSVSPGDLYEELRPLVIKGRTNILEMAKEWSIPEWKSEEAPIPMKASKKTLDSYRSYLAQDFTVNRISDYLWEKYPVQVFSTYFRLPDVTSHFAWHFLDEKIYDDVYAKAQSGEITPADVARLDRDFARVLEPVYRFMDSVVDKYMKRIDENTALIVCSDHGFMFTDGVYAHGELARVPPDGVIFMAGPGVRKGARIEGATLYDIAPTILHLIGQPVAEDMDGKVVDAFEPDFLEDRPIKKIATFETTKRQTGTSVDGATEMDEKILEDLETLGYIEPKNKSEKPQEQKDGKSPDAKEEEPEE